MSDELIAALVDFNVHATKSHGSKQEPALVREKCALKDSIHELLLGDQQALVFFIARNKIRIEDTSRSCARARVINATAFHLSKWGRGSCLA
jgi:hypothetical protein